MTGKTVDTRQKHWRRTVGLMAALMVAAALGPGPAADAQGCSCRSESVDQELAAADGVFVGTVIEAASGPTSRGPSGPWRFSVDQWIKGDPDADEVTLDPGACSNSRRPDETQQVVRFFSIGADGRAHLHGCSPPLSSVRWFTDPPALSTGPARYLLTSAGWSPMAVDRSGRLVAADPDRSKTAIEATVGCADGRVALLMDDEVVVDELATFSEVERLQFRRNTRRLLCPAGRILAVAGPWQAGRVYDVPTREPLTGDLTEGSPADAVGDLLVFSAQADDAPASIRLRSLESENERVLAVPAELTGGANPLVVSLEVSPNSDRVAFSIKTGAGKNKLTEVFVYGLRTGTRIARIEAARTRGHVLWLDDDHLLFRTNQGVATVYDPVDLSVVSELGPNMRWVQHLEDEDLVGFAVGTGAGAPTGIAMWRMPLAGGDIAVAATLPHNVEVTRLPTGVTMETTGSAPTHRLDLPITSESLDDKVGLLLGDATFFVPAPGDQHDQSGADTPDWIWALALTGVAGVGLASVIARRRRSA